MFSDMALTVSEHVDGKELLIGLVGHGDFKPLVRPKLIRIVPKDFGKDDKGRRLRRLKVGEFRSFPVREATTVFSVEKVARHPITLSHIPRLRANL